MQGEGHYVAVLQHCSDDTDDPNSSKQDKSKQEKLSKELSTAWEAYQSCVKETLPILLQQGHLTIQNIFSHIQ